MNSVKINKKELLQIVRNNREESAKEYSEANQEYERLMIENLGEAINEIKTNGRIKDADIYLVPPIDSSSCYDKIIKMLEISVDDVIELTHEQFSEYVLDNLPWRRYAKTTNQKYISRP